MEKIKIKKMYLEEYDGKGTHTLILVGENGKEYAGEVEVHNVREELKFYEISE